MLSRFVRCRLANPKGITITDSLDCEPYPCPKSNWRGCNQGDMPQIWADGRIANGGVPQAANLSRHLERLRQGIAKWIPDPEWAGNAMYDVR